jgi:hypothetical protein
MERALFWGQESMEHGEVPLLGVGEHEAWRGPSSGGRRAWGMESSLFWGQESKDHGEPSGGRGI